MDEGREQPPAPQPGTRPVAAAARLSPVQAAYSAYTQHATRCLVCRDPDAGRCEVAETLWHTYRERDAEAYRRMTDETP